MPLKKKIKERELILSLRSQAKNKADANRWFGQTPDKPEDFLEWQAADVIEKLLENKV